MITEQIFLRPEIVVSFALQMNTPEYLQLSKEQANIVRNVSASAPDTGQDNCQLAYFFVLLQKIVDVCGC